MTTTSSGDVGDDAEVVSDHEDSHTQFGLQILH